MSELRALAASPRDRAGKGAARATRREGFVPAVIYGGKDEPTLIKLDPRQLLAALRKPGFWGTQFSIDYVAHPSGVGHASATVTQPDGSKRHVVFDATGYPAADTWGYGTPLARTTLYERDATTGRIEARTDPLGRRTEYVYNAVGQTTQVTYLAGTPEAQSLQMAYNANGDLTLMTDALGRETRLEYTAGCLSAVIDPLGKRTEIACTGFGQPRTITNPLQQVVSFEYLGHEVVSVTDPLGRQVRYRHDALGRVVAVEDSQGRLTRREYDLNHRVTRIGNGDRFIFRAAAGWALEGKAPNRSWWRMRGFAARSGQPSPAAAPASGPSASAPVPTSRVRLR